jgi:hypothetical protein
MHEVAEALPERAKFVTPEGAAAPLEPVTVAVKMTEPPRVGAPEEVSTTVGIIELTVVELVEATTATAL